MQILNKLHCWNKNTINKIIFKRYLSLSRTERTEIASFSCLSNESTPAVGFWLTRKVKLIYYL